MSASQLKRIAADFNNVGGLDVIKASDRGEGANVGERVVLYDHEGNECQGVVRDAKRLLYVEMDWAFWKAGADDHLYDENGHYIPQLLPGIEEGGWAWPWRRRRSS
jgi:hypothetical protein